jgi:hypothetical protein
MPGSGGLSRAAPVALLLALYGCGSDGPRPVGMETDSAGVLIVESEAGVEEWALSVMPSLVIGPAPESSTEPLYRVVGVTRVGETIVVANGGTNQVYLYDLEGNRVRTLGRSGGGPGEFERLSDVLIIPGDSLLTYDTGLRRFQVFDLEGRFIRSLSLEAPEPGAVLTGVVPLGIGEGGTLIVRTLGRPDDRQTTTRARMDVLSYSLTGEFLDSIISAPGWEAFNSPTGLFRNVPIPFGHSSSLAMIESRVIVGVSEANEIRFHTLNGTMIRIIRNVAPPGPRVERTEVADLVARAVESAPMGMGGEMRALYEEMPVPERKPPFTWIYGWVDRSVWIRTSQGDGGSRRFLVLKENDGRSAWLSVPREFDPMDVRDGKVLGTWTDQLGIESIREYRMIRGGERPH